jgi:hypothetical protein
VPEIFFHAASMLSTAPRTGRCLRCVCPAAAKLRESVALPCLPALSKLATRQSHRCRASTPPSPQSPPLAGAFSAPRHFSSFRRSRAPLSSVHHVSSAKMLCPVWSSKTRAHPATSPGAPPQTTPRRPPPSCHRQASCQRHGRS